MPTIDRWRPYLTVPTTIAFPQLDLISGHDWQPPIAQGYGEVRILTPNRFEYTLHGTAHDAPYAIRAITQQRKNPYDALGRFRLIGVDNQGIHWNCGWTIPTVQFNAQPWCFEGEITALATTDESNTASKTNSAELLFAFPPRHPVSDLVDRLVRTEREGDVPLNERTLDACGTRIHFSYNRSNGYLSVMATTSSDLRHPYLENWLAEPFRILFGELIYPRLVARNFETGKALVSVRQTALPEPRPGFAALWSTASIKKDKTTFWSLYRQILEVIALARNDDNEPGFEAHNITQLYEELIQAQRGSRWVWGLTLASTMEGLTQKFAQKKAKRPDADSTGIAELSRPIASWHGPAQLKQAATQRVHRTAEVTTAYLLRRLVITGVIDEAQLKAWRDIRNSVMHGNLVLPWSTKEEDDQLLALAEATHNITAAVLRKHRPMDGVTPATTKAPNNSLIAKFIESLTKWISPFRQGAKPRKRRGTEGQR